MQSIGAVVTTLAVLAINYCMIEHVSTATFSNVCLNVDKDNNGIYVKDKEKTDAASNGWYGFVKCYRWSSGLKEVTKCGFGPSADDIKVKVKPGKDKKCGEGKKWTCSCKRVMDSGDEGLEPTITDAEDGPSTKS